MTDADLLRRILGAMRPDIPMDWHDQAWLAAKGLATLEAIEAEAATLAPLDEVVAALVMKKLPMVEPVGDRKTNAINSQRASWNAAIDFALDALDAPIDATPAPLDVERLTRAIVEVEESKLCNDCFADVCEVHEEFYEASIGCGDAIAIAADYAEETK